MGPRRAMHTFRLAVVTALAAVIVGCGATPTPAPSSLAPSEAATPSPVQASPNPNLVAFETHIRDATTREGQIVRALAAASGGPNTQLALAARQLVTWAADEQSWLDDNVADSCYEDAWQSWSSGVEDIANAAAEFRRLADRASPPTDAEGQAAGAALSDGGESLGVAADLAQQARAACR